MSDLTPAFSPDEKTAWRMAALAAAGARFVFLQTKKNSVAGGGLGRRGRTRRFFFRRKKTQHLCWVFSL
jgi:hypothetical protein